MGFFEWCEASYSLFWTEELLFYRFRIHIVALVWWLIDKFWFDLLGSSLFFFSFRLILIPIHLQEHWALVSIDPNQYQITYLDSYHNTVDNRCNSSCTNFLLNQLVHSWSSNRSKQANFRLNSLQVLTLLLSLHTSLSVLLSRSMELLDTFFYHQVIDPDQWNLINDKNIPYQTNDCGAFVCKYGQCLSNRQDFNFDQLFVHFY